MLENRTRRRTWSSDRSGRLASFTINPDAQGPGSRLGLSCEHLARPRCDDPSCPAALEAN